MGGAHGFTVSSDGNLVGRALKDVAENAALPLMGVLGGGWGFNNNDCNHAWRWAHSFGE